MRLHGSPIFGQGEGEGEGSPVVFPVLFGTNFLRKFMRSIPCIASSGLRFGRARKCIFDLGAEIS